MPCTVMLRSEAEHSFVYVGSFILSLNVKFCRHLYTTVGHNTHIPSHCSCSHVIAHIKNAAVGIGHAEHMQPLNLTSSTNGGRSVGIVRSRSF
jgi:hypothetical protein